MKAILIAGLLTLPVAAHAERTGTVAVVHCASGSGETMSLAVSRAQTELNSYLRTSWMREGTSPSAPTITVQSYAPNSHVVTMCVTTTSQASL